MRKFVNLSLVPVLVSVGELCHRIVLYNVLITIRDDCEPVRLHEYKRQRSLVCVCVCSCPFDYIKVYDGADNEAEEIDTYCGSITDNRTIYSTGQSLNIVFETKSGRAEATQKSYITYDEKQTTEIKRRGFRAVFEISESFVNLGKALSIIPGMHLFCIHLFTVMTVLH